MATLKRIWRRKNQEIMLKFLRGDVGCFRLVCVYFVRIEDIIKEDWFSRVDWRMILRLKCLHALPTTFGVA